MAPYFSTEMVPTLQQTPLTVYLARIWNSEQIVAYGCNSLG